MNGPPVVAFGWVPVVAVLLVAALVLLGALLRVLVPVVLFVAAVVPAALLLLALLVAVLLPVDVLVAVEVVPEALRVAVAPPSFFLVAEPE